MDWWRVLDSFSTGKTKSLSVSFCHHSGDHFNGTEKTTKNLSLIPRLVIKYDIELLAF